MRAASGGQVGPYEILELLGSGGAGVVYRAHDHRLGRHVALKVLLPEIADDVTALSRFEREARAVAALSHPNILAIYDFQREGDTVYAAMELLAGPTLRERLKSGPLPPRKAVDVAVQVARGLAAAHDKRLVHRDLKPENLAFTRDGRVKILDFGLARENVAPLDAGTDSPTKTRQTTPGMVIGTVGYMSPEQIRGHEVDHRSDLFALGAVLYEMMTGRRAFEGATAADIMSAILNEDTRDVRESGVKLPPALDRVVRRCLEKHPAERFQSARDLAFALENAAGDGWQARPAPTRSRERPLLGRALLLATGLAVGAALMLWVRPPLQHEPVLRRELTHSGLDSAPSVSLDQMSVVFASRRSGVSRIWSRSLNGSAATPLTDGPDRRPRYFPGGRDLLFLRRDGKTDSVFRMSLDSDVTTWVLSDVVEADPSPDGRRIAFVRFGGEDAAGGATTRVAMLGVAPADGTGSATELLRVPNAELASVRWSPDGARIAAVRQGISSPMLTTVVIVDVAKRAPPQYLEASAGSAFGSLAWIDDRRLVVTQSDTTQVYVPGAPGRVVALDTRGGDRQTLFYETYLFGLFRAVDSNSRIEVADSGQLVFDPVTIRQTLEERSLEAAHGRGRELTFGSNLDRQPAYSPDGTVVVFTSNRSSNLDLWLVTGDGDLHQLTNDPSQDWDPAFSPDGRHLVWSSDRGGHLEIWMGEIDLDGQPSLSKTVQVSSDGVDAQNPTMTKEGVVVYTTGNPESPGVWKVRSDGTEAQVLVPGEQRFFPEVSPDGRYALYLEYGRPQLRSMIRVVEIGTGRLVDFGIPVDFTLDESNADITRGRARWTRDGRIMFVGQDENGVGIFDQAFEAGRDTTNTRRLVVPSAPGRLTESFALSPDGTKITVSFGNYTRTVMLAESVPGIESARDGRR